MAISTFNNNLEQLSESQAVELARAFLINEDYEKAVEICQRVSGTKDAEVYFDAGLLMVKARYLAGGKGVGQMIREVEARVGREGSGREEAKWWGEAIREIKEVLDFQSNNNAAKSTKNQLRDFWK